jgi:hypothetical protein
VARAAKLVAHRDPASAAARAAADAAAERVTDAVLATRKALDAQIWAMKASRDAEEEAVLHPTRAKKQAASAAAEQVKQLEAEVAAAQQEEAEAVAASTVEDVVPEPVEPPAEPPAEPAAEPAAPAVVDLAGEEPEAGGGVPAPPVEPAQVAPPAAAIEPAAQVQAAAGPSAAPRRQTRSGRAGVVVPIKKTSTKARAKRAVTLPMPEAFIPTPMGITQPAPTPIITSVAPSVRQCTYMAQPTPMQVEPPQVPLAQPMDISPTHVAVTQAVPVVCTTVSDAGQVPVSMLMSPQRTVPRVTVLMTGPTLYGTLAGLVSPVPEPVAVPQPVQPVLTSTPGLSMPIPTPPLGRTSTGHVGLPPIPTPVDISALPPLPSAQPLPSTLSGLDLADGGN